jgi:hypothetical protein
MLEIRAPGTGWRSWAYQTNEAQGTVLDAIEGISIPTLLRRIGERTIDLLKLDIEGSEEELFARGSLEWLGRVGVLSVETHGDRAARVVATALRQASFAQLRTESHRLVFVHPALRLSPSKHAEEESSPPAALVPS